MFTSRSETSSARAGKGGRTWTSQDLPADAGGFGVIADDVFVLFTGHPQPSTLRSTDLGTTWSDPVPVDLSPFDRGGGGWSQISRIPGGPALMTVQCYYTGVDPETGESRTGEKPGIYDHIYRSTDESTRKMEQAKWRIDMQTGLGNPKRT